MLFVDLFLLPLLLLLLLLSSSLARPLPPAPKPSPKRTHASPTRPPTSHKKRTKTKRNEKKTPPGAASASDRLLARAEEGSAAAQALVSSALARALAGASAAAGGAAAASSAAMGSASAAVPSATGVVYFAALLGSGALFLAIAFFVFLPMLVVAPAKFAACFSLGSGLVVAAPAALRGAAAHARSMLGEERRPLTAAYCATLFLTLWASLGLHSYLLSLAACAGQICALAYYAASYVPGGAAGLRAAGGVAASALGSVFSSK